MRAGKDPSVAQAEIEDAHVLCASGDGVTTGNPHLDFVATLFGTCLGDASGCSKQYNGQHEGSHK